MYRHLIARFLLFRLSKSLNSRCSWRCTVSSRTFSRSTNALFPASLRTTESSIFVPLSPASPWSDLPLPILLLQNHQRLYGLSQHYQ
ncbi:hypothetical protein OESDEN_21749 [Oesophagostomum dentatum]|uniref:Uncharacterized protein n=1 Tax=Oesophagostomum dentatum TaxID=61180 RepID=A0A0B1RZZ9_OESDE|nr:hypothetical protein OESDEN_21749 [Oesophagostomum dentatum]